MSTKTDDHVDLNVFERARRSELESRIIANKDRKSRSESPASNASTGTD